MQVHSLANEAALKLILMQEWTQQLSLQVHREALQAELKMIRDDLHRVVLELTERQQRVDRLHAKWDVTAGGHKGEDGEEHSQASHTLSVACFTHVYLLRLSLDTKPVMMERDVLAWSSEGRNASQRWLQRSRTGSCMHDVCTKSSTHQRFNKLSVHPEGAAHACPAAVCTCRHLSSQACPQICQAAPQLKGAAGGHYVLDCRDCDLTGMRCRPIMSSRLPRSARSCSVRGTTWMLESARLSASARACRPPSIS